MSPLSYIHSVPNQRYHAANDNKNRYDEKNRRNSQKQKIYHSPYCFPLKGAKTIKKNRKSKMGN